MLDGRRPAYLFALPVFAIGSAGVAAAQSIPSLLFWRFFQSMGASIGPVIGAAVIGDIFKLEERGRAVGVSLGVGKSDNPLFTSDVLSLFRFIKRACSQQLSLLLLEVHLFFPIAFLILA